jgi:hypothetical protein
MRRLALLLMTWTLSLVPLAQAQIPPCVLGDDGFNAGCCSVPAPNLPPLPPSAFPAEYACVSNCALLGQQTVQVTLTTPQYILCDYAITNFTATLPGGIVISGPILMKYARTWSEMDAVTGMPFQVWRFLTNTDASYLATAIVPGAVCPVPLSALPPFSLPVHFNGHIDYACQPTPVSPTTLLRFSLSHLPPCISHAPWSTRPLPAGAVPNASYHLVGPSPFAFALGPAIPGPVIAESVRTSNFTLTPFNYQCRGEATVLQGNLANVQQDCLCGPSSITNMPWTHQALGASVCCGTALTPLASLPVPGTPVAPTGLTALTLGSWPGSAGIAVSTLTIYFGVLQYADPCNAANWPIHVVVGVRTNTLQGRLFPGSTPGACGAITPIFVQHFLDLQNVLPLATASPVPLLGYGSLFGSDAVFNLNLP